MSRRCSKCSRANPSEAAYCFYDGLPLNGASGAAGESINFGTWAFPSPFVFASGEKCRNFLQLALACQRDPPAAADMLQQGYLEKFFGSLGRVDLAVAAAAAAKAPDKERGLDDLLGKIPGAPLQPPQLQVEPTQTNLGVVPVGEDRRFDLTLTNAKDRLIYGKASVDTNCSWIVLGDSGAPEKLFQFFDKSTLPVRIVGKRLRAYEKPQRAEIVLESNAGNVTVVVEIAVPVKAFSEGVLSGALSPRQLAAKAKQQVKEAAVLIENGAVARWYESNGWTYPVQGPTASGQAAVQQLFETLGLVKPPKVELSEPAVTLRGKPGQRLEHAVSVVTQEKRAAVAYGASDQPWLTVGRPTYRGQTATIPLIVAEAPDQPGATLTACLKVTANGNQRFDVPVTLCIGDGPAVPAPVQSSKPTPAPKPAPTPEPSPFAFEEPAAAVAAPPPEPAPFLFDAPPVVTPALAPAPVAPTPAPAAVAAVPLPAVAAASPLAGILKQRKLWIRLLPIGIVAIGLLTALGRDLWFREGPDPQIPEVDYEHPVLDLKFHDAPQPNDFVPTASMTFGLGVPDPSDPKKFKTKLTYDEFGRTNNVCVRIGQKPDFEYLWGVEQGQWKQPVRQDLGKDQEGHRLIGAKAVWGHPDPPITIAQYVEIVPGGLSPDGKKRLLDTCLVRYDITNDDNKANAVGLRFLLDTYIGSNDAVPFTIAGAKELCDTMKEFNSPSEVPDFISALEHQDLQKPGIVAHLSLKYGGGLEPPTRVTLGAWPASSLRELPGGAKADMQNTHWDVPVLPMADAKSAENPNGDSAVTLYWDVKDIPPKQTRTVGFAYGLGSVTGDGGEGQLGMTAGGEVVAGKEFTLTAYVKNPAPGATLSLTLPRGLEVTEGREKESVAPVPPGSSSPYSPVTWKVRATKGGVYTIGLTLNSGAKLQHKLVVPASLEVLH